MQTLLDPQSRSGWWSAALAILFFMLLAVQLADLFPVPGVGLAILGVAAMGLALFAILCRRERSLWAFLAVAGGLLVLVFALANLFGSPY
jgi:hypothetical protein